MLHHAEPSKGSSGTREAASDTRQVRRSYLACSSTRSSSLSSSRSQFSSPGSPASLSAYPPSRAASESPRPSTGRPAPSCRRTPCWRSSSCADPLVLLITCWLLPCFCRKSQSGDWRLYPECRYPTATRTASPCSSRVWLLSCGYVTEPLSSAILCSLSDRSRYRRRPVGGKRRESWRRDKGRIRISWWIITHSASSLEICQLSEKYIFQRIFL